MIYTEGRNTEPKYFKSFADIYANSMVDVHCVGAAGVPVTIVDLAHEELKKLKRSRDRYERGDQVWAVFDRDDHHEVAHCIKRAKSLGIFVGYSNPCFEVWLILHHENYDAPDDRHQVQKRLGNLDKSYDPSHGKECDFSELNKKYCDAKSRAEIMRQRRIDEGQELSRPYTDVDLLTETIIVNGKAGRKV